MPESLNNFSFSERRQGDIFDVSNVGEIRTISNQNGIDKEKLVIISQTCDVVLASRRKIILAPIVELEPVLAANARRGNQSQYIPITKSPLGENIFADITCLVTIDKSLLGQATFICSSVEGDNLTEIEKFGKSIARRFARFPVPNDVVPWIKPLQDLVRNKSRKQNSIKDAIDSLEDLRISADQWFGTSRTIQLHLIVGIDEKSMEDDFDPSWTVDRIRGVPKGESFDNLKLEETCSLLKLNEEDVSSKTRIWDQIALLLSEQIQPPANCNDDEILNAIIDVKVNVFSENEFTYDKLRNSQSLDLEDLSN